MKRFSLMLTMLFFSITIALAQRTITGTVTDAQSKDPLIGATVAIKGTTVGTITDVDGKYSLEVPANTTLLVFTYVGYTTQEISLGASNIVEVSLSEGKALQEVIVTALGTTRETKALGYAAQQVDGDKLKDANTTNVVDALNGRVAGAQINSSSGTAGASSRIVVRGQTSLDGNNQALFVVDGLRIDNSELGTDASSIGTAGTAGVSQSNRAIDINPSDIESITVLKGAAASALYGIDGARGVILITTKKGNKKGKGLTVEYNSTFTQSSINRKIPLQNKFGLGSAGTPLSFTSGSPLVWGPRLDSMFYDGVATEFDVNGSLVGKSNPAAKLDRPAKVYDPYSIFQTGLTTQHNLSITGGDAEKTSFRLAIGNLSEEGIIPKNTFRRTNITLGTTSNLLENKLRFRSMIQYVKSDSRRIIQGNSASGLLLGLLRTPPTFDNANGSADPFNDRKSIYFTNGQQRTFRNGIGFDNPYWVINNVPYTDEVNRFLGNLDVTYEFFKGLSINTKVGTDIYQDNRIQKYEINSRAVPAGRIFDDRFTSRNLDAYLTALGTFSLTKDLNMSYTVGGNMYSSYLNNITVQGDGLDNAGFVNFNNTRSKLVTPTNRNQKNLSLLGSLDFGYKSFLYLGFTGRKDWVSNLIVPAKGMSGSAIGFFYPSANMSFVFSEIAKIKGLDYGKLRFSVGQVGGGAPNPYLTSTPYTVPVIADAWTGGVSFPFKNQYGLSLSDVKGATDLKPSKTTDVEIGLEAKVLKNRITLDLSLYQRSSSDQILAVPVSAATGSAFKVLNTGSLSTKGMDLVLGFNPIRLENSFRWDVNFNFTTWNTKIESLSEGIKAQFVGGFNILMSVQNLVGEEYGQLYGGAFMRTNDATGTKFDPNLAYNPTGRLVIEDNAANANYGRPKVHPGNVKVGNPNPDYLLGITNSFSFKGLTVSALFDIRQGGELWNGTRGTLQNFGMAASTENRGESTVFDGVKAGDGSPNNISTKLDQSWYTGLGSGFGAVQSQFIESSAFMRLRSLNISYRFEPSWIKKAKLSDLTVGLTGRNLWLKTDYTGVDPETSLLGARNAQGIDFYNMPNTTSWALTFGLKF